jgi:hypothetical protein
VIATVEDITTTLVIRIPSLTPHAPPCGAITLPGNPEGGDLRHQDHDHHFRGIGIATRTAAPCSAFPRTLHHAGRNRRG